MNSMIQYVISILLLIIFVPVLHIISLIYFDKLITYLSKKK